MSKKNHFNSVWDALEDDPVLDNNAPLICVFHAHPAGKSSFEEAEPEVEPRCTGVQVEFQR
jgi:hypothetical protein